MVHRYFRQLPLLLSLLGLLIFGGFASNLRAQAAVAPDPGTVAEKHETIPLKATPIFTIGKFTVTNSMLVTWIVAAGIIVFAQTATRKIKQVPTGAQNFWEWLVEGLYNFLESVIGSHLVKKTFWFFSTIFIFILFLNWFGLIPGVGTIGWGHHDPVTNAFRVDRPLLRGGNADLNLTFAMAATFFMLWIVWALQENGVGGFIVHLFGPKGDSKGILKILMIIVFFMVGWLEIVSILFRPISLSFRLYGNVYAGENMLEAMAHLVPALSWLIPIPFYFMELLVGIVQALVFMLLTAVFTLLIAHHEPVQSAQQ
ncbi:MAG: F0F1 ATP synthase subunit A [Chthoniobacterales bacterium]|nr:F0F1 ATP synthase subunit A [Chthoniobacterales bacterium]